MLLYVYSFPKPLTCLFFLVLQDLEKKKTFFCSELVAAAQQAVSRVLTTCYIYRHSFTSTQYIYL
jgi:hypothetical protein